MDDLNSGGSGSAAAASGARAVAISALDIADTSTSTTSTTTSPTSTTSTTTATASISAPADSPPLPPGPRGSQIPLYNEVFRMLPPYAVPLPSASVLHAVRYGELSAIEDPTDAENETMRRTALVGNMLSNLVDAKAEVDEKKQEAPKAAQHAQDRPRSSPTASSAAIALNMMAMASTKKKEAPSVIGIQREDDVPKECSFCWYDSSFGVSDPRVWLPETASSGFCAACHESTMTVTDLWQSTYKLPYGMDEEEKAKHRDITAQFVNPPLKELGGEYDFHQQALDEMNKPARVEMIARFRNRIQAETSASGLRNAGPPRPPSVTSVAVYGPQFCRGCPWLQLDFTKATICTYCKEEKTRIVNHRHVGFGLLNQIEGLVEREYAHHGGGEFANDVAGAGNRYTRCMICPGLATYRCDECPLRICVTCQVFLTNLGKGRLNDLLVYYMSSRDHVRNDAFLLRSDGRGF